MRHAILIAAILTASPAWGITIDAESYGNAVRGPGTDITWQFVPGQKPAIGEGTHGVHLRAYVLFDLPSTDPLVEPWTDAYLLLPAGTTPPDWPLIINQVGSTAAQAIADWIPLGFSNPPGFTTTVFNDVDDGSVLSLGTPTLAQDGRLRVDLNQDGVDLIRLSQGGWFAVGLDYAFNPTPNEAFATGLGDGTYSLVLTVPEPASLVLVIVGIAGLWIRRAPKPR